jgi:aspartyl-tRNA(Asn)/glutamyl-tRNA(Gln) amidotransferase subunit C
VVRDWVDSRTLKRREIHQHMCWQTFSRYNVLMPLTLEEVKHIATLARLELSEQELARYREQLSAILDYVARFQELDTNDIPPTSSVLSERSPLRTDAARPGLSTEELLKNAPDVESDQFKIPPVFE